MGEAQSRPAEVKQIVCLANSRKLSGRCLAGREISGDKPGPWIRPVSGREHQEVSEFERRYQDGRDPEVLDVIAVPVVRSIHHLFQQENWLLDDRFHWERKGRSNWTSLPALVDPLEPLWINGQSSYRCLNNRVALAQAEQLRNSLRLIRVNEVEIEVFSPGAAFGNAKRRVQGRFEHMGVRYWLWVTDPAYERRFLVQPDGRHRLGESYLTISLGEPHEGFCYKLIAAIMERSQIEKR